MKDASHFTMILDIAESAWFMDFCHKAIYPCGLRSHLRNCMADVKISRYWLDQFLTLAFTTWISSKFSVFNWISVLIILLILVGVELLLSIVVIVFFLS